MEAMADSEDLARDFCEYSRKKLIGEFWLRTCTCLDALTDEQVWWRPNEASNSIGNLLLHLNGNIRQWIVHGIGEIAYERDRDAEFAERKHLPVSVLRAKLDETLQQASAVLSGLSAGDLIKRHTIQGYEVSALDAIYHVVEHFAMHHGQILYLTKALTGEDLGFYRHLSGKHH